ncbi:hypothetical protein PGT21_022387 [Puccinia graminis f. sp. tritici]|uniref:Uncharacterized protein n=1 Tax=Puccinia graminis f. sp. tritici TaxID=56615 RepID=A0A5B0P342_PUCGR|nr:hypothetical protein PGT21_022387 [Puccinia graminis f. sp. tritici]
MPSINFAQSRFFKRSLACCFAFRYTGAWPQPALQAPGESHSIGSDFHSSQDGLYDVVNSWKRPLANQQTPGQPDFFGADRLSWVDLRAYSNYQATNPEDNVISNVAKRQKKQGPGGRTTQPNLVLNAGVTQDGLFPEMQFEGAQGRHQPSHGFYQLASFHSPSTSPASFLPPSSHSIFRKEMLSTSAQEYQKEPTPESMFGFMSQREMGTENDDFKISSLFKQLQSPEFATFHAQQTDHDQGPSQAHPPQPGLVVGNNKAHVQERIPIQPQPHDGQDDTHQIQQSNHQLEGHSNNQAPLAPISLHAHSRSEFSRQLNENHRFSSKKSLDQDQAKFSSNPHQVSDSDESKNVHTASRSIPLTNTLFLTKSMDDEFLGHFVKKFKYHLLEIFMYAMKGKNGNDYPIDGLPTRISLKNGVYVVRIEVDPEILSTSSPHRSKMQTGTKVFSLFSDLIEWLLFINTAVLRRSDEMQAIKNLELEAHRELVNWLFQEAFHPSGSAPVLGTISPDALHRLKRGQEFGLIQTTLIKYLSFLQKPQETCRAALLITRKYYEEVKPEIFKGLGRLNQVDFDFKINSIIADGIKFRMNVGRASDVSKVQRQLENFAICDIENLPRSMKPRSHKAMYDVGLGEKEKEILKYFENNSRICLD